jgi:hypothetical protein
MEPTQGFVSNWGGKCCRKSIQLPQDEYFTSLKIQRASQKETDLNQKAQACFTLYPYLFFIQDHR